MKNSNTQLNATETPRWATPLALAVAALFLIEIYRPALNGPFLFDDLYLPFLVPNFASSPLRSWVVGVRPTLNVSYWLNYRMFGQEPLYYHWMNLVLHAGCAYFLWLISNKIVGFVLGAKARWFSIFAVAVFMLHPLQTESVGYVASRSEILSGLFFLIAWTVFLYRKEPSIRFSEAALVVLFFLFAITSKEHTAVLPAVLLLTDFFFNPGFSFKGIRDNWRLYVPIFAGATLGVYLVFTRVLAGARTAGFGLKDLTPSDYLFTQFRSVVTYLRLFVAPFGQNVDHSVVISRSLATEFSWLCLLILLGLAGLAWAKRREFPLASYGYFLFLILLAPTSSFVPIQDVLVERRMYLPVFALTLCVVDALRHAQAPPKALMAGICVVLAFLTWQRNQVWASGVALWKDAVTGSPAKYRPRFQLAYAYWQAGQCVEAAREYAEAAKLAPPNYELFVDWALAADCAGRPEEALARLEDAAKLEKNAHAYALMGMVHGKRGSYDRALEALAEAERINPRFEATFVYKGNVHMARSEWEQAVAAFRQAISIEPQESSAQAGLRQALAGQRRAQTRKQP